MTILEINAQSQTVIERDPTAEELAQREIDAAEYEAKQSAELAREEAKASAEAKLAALGLTSEEIAALRA